MMVSPGLSVEKRASSPTSSEPRCDCRTDERCLVLLASNLSQGYPELLSFAAKVGWKVGIRLGAVRVELGTGHQLASVAELINFLRGVLEPDRLASLRAAWVTRQQPMEEQLDKLLHAEPLMKLAPADSSPLPEILRSLRLETWYQPIVSARDASLWGYECLVRGRTLAGELVMPDQLIAWSRQENLTFMLDRICRETHLRNAAKVLGGRKDVHLLLNFLPTAIYNAEFCLATTVAVSKLGGFEPRQIFFELVETESFKNLPHLRSILDYYRRKGFRVALDDLGSGYSGLILLGDLNPDMVKIDRQLISRTVESQMHRDICASLIRLGRDHGKLVLAEGIETIEQKNLLGSMGVDLFQGYLFGRPDPVPAVPARIK